MQATANWLLGTVGLTPDEVDAGGYYPDGTEGKFFRYVDWESPTEAGNIAFEVGDARGKFLQVEMSQEDMVRLWAGIGRAIIENGWSA